VHYFIAGMGGAGMGGAGMGGAGMGGGMAPGDQTASAASQITSWVQSHFTATAVGGTTVYDLTSGTPST
jgi:hypothetical protein